MAESIEERFLEFHEANPHVYDELVRRARSWRARHGHKKLAIATLYEVVRWFHYMKTEDPSSDFRLNNDYRAPYARLIMSQEPDLAGVFETRRTRGEAVPEPVSESEPRLFAEVGAC